MPTYLEVITYIASGVSLIVLALLSMAARREYKDNSDWVIDYAAGKPYRKEIKRDKTWQS